MNSLDKSMAVMTAFLAAMLAINLWTSDREGILIGVVGLAFCSLYWGADWLSKKLAGRVDR